MRISNYTTVRQLFIPSLRRTVPWQKPPLPAETLPACDKPPECPALHMC